MAHSFTAGYAHFVFSTKDRIPNLPTDADRLYAYIGGIIRAEESNLIIAGGSTDHVHLLVHLHPSRSFSELMRVVKARSSAWIKETSSSANDFAWQSGYGGFSVSKSALDSVEAYIRNQPEHHRTMDFKQEFIALLERHGVEYDPKYVFG